MTRSSGASSASSTNDRETLHRRLNEFNRSRFAPSTDCSDWEHRLRSEQALRVLEAHFVEGERVAVMQTSMQAPTDPDGFVQWFETLKQGGPGQADPLFPWLAEDASLHEMKWFLSQEVGGEAGFDDLVALTQVKLPVRPKLEMARNYWDEMGQGHEGGMHGPMLEHLAGALHLDTSGCVWESLALGNLMAALASNRHYTYQSVGALGVIELTAPTRAEKVNAGLKRLGIGGDVRRYFALHATLDVRHSQTWDREVIRPLIAENPQVAPAIAEGALMRLNAGARCFARYRCELAVRPRAEARAVKPYAA
jgi:hypothetical protein